MQTMTKQIIIGIVAEGTTDIRFLKSIVQRTFEEIAFECTEDIEIFDPIEIPTKREGTSIGQKAISYAIEGEKNGIMTLCFHVDADDDNDKEAFENRINPAFQSIETSSENLCKNLVAIVPIQMTESWMLADKDLLKNELNTEKSDQELGLHRKPETIANPKQTIIEAIRIVNKERTKRRRKDLKIEDLYQSIGQRMATNKLDNLSSYKKFKNAVRESFGKLNIHFDSIKSH